MLRARENKFPKFLGGTLDAKCITQSHMIMSDMMNEAVATLLILQQTFALSRMHLAQISCVRTIEL